MSVTDAPVQETWFVAVEGKSYGPYTLQQVAEFVANGRVTAQTPVMRNSEAWSRAGEHAGLAAIFAGRPAETGPSAPEGAPEAPAQQPLAKIVIIAELKSGSSISFEAAIARLGESYRMNQFVWFLMSDRPMSVIRKELIQHAGKHDPLFIADTTNARADWLNFGPGAAATIKALWHPGR